MDTTVLDIINPLQAMPSMLAVRDIRRRIVASGALSRSPDSLKRLLGLDPLSTMRAIRVASAPVNGLKHAITSLDQLAAELGGVFVQRVLDVPVIESDQTAYLRKLWLHSVATAHAARSLALASGVTDPEEAYLKGLLHDLPVWLEQLGIHARGEPWPLTAEEFRSHWNLMPIPATREELDLDLDPLAIAHKHPESLITVAEVLAELSDFCHPGHTPEDSTRLLSLTSKEMLLQAHSLRLDLKRALEEFGLDFSPAGFTIGPQSATTSDLRLFQGQSLGNLAQLVVSLLQCSRSSSYLGIVTVATSAALRYLDFERAYFISWNPQTRLCWIRAKADLSIQQMTRLYVEPTSEQIELLQRARDSDTPQILFRDPRASCLLGLTGADHALVACVNRDYSTPTYLMLDRNLTGRPIDLEVDGKNAAALGGTVAILTNNLELRLRQTRAERFAMTDPLTRLTNRGVGLLQLEQELARAKRDPKPLCVLMLDLDEFKDLNDQHGHLVGDQALRMVSNVLRKTLRKSDTVCRYGGEEFLVVLPDTTPEEASILATRLFVAVEEAGLKQDLPVTVSIGLATMRPDDEADHLVSRADRALYASKSRGRNRFSVDTD